MTVPNYKEFDDGEYSRFRRSLIRKDGSRATRQRAFLEKVLNTQTFLDYLKQEAGITGKDDLDPLAEKMSEAEFQDPPRDTEQRLFQAWADLTPRIACRTTFWGYVTWRHIKEGRIQPYHLAANGGSKPGGEARIEKALASSGEEGEKLLDSCVRTILRRLGGLPEARGNRTVYVNCPLARSWWRERFVREASNDDPEIARQVREVVRIKQEYWEKLVLFIVSRNSVFGSPEIRTSLVRRIGKKIDGNPRSPLRVADKFLLPACRSLSTLQSSRELSVLSSSDVENMVDIVVEMHLRALSVDDAEDGQNS